MVTPLHAQSTDAKPSAGPLKAPPTQDSLAAISWRGELLRQYDFVAWIATDSVTARGQGEGLVQGYVARRRGNRCDVAFGRPSAGRHTFYVAFEARQRESDPNNFDVAELRPARADTGYYARASRAIAVA